MVTNPGSSAYRHTAARWHPGENGAPSADRHGHGCGDFRAARIPIRTLAVAATDHGLLAPELAAGIARPKSAKSISVGAPAAGV